MSRFGDDIWDLSPLARREHEPGRRINWVTFPSALRGSFKRAGWALITLPTPEALLERVATSRVEHPSAGTMAAVTSSGAATPPGWPPAAGGLLAEDLWQAAAGDGARPGWLGPGGISAS
jgi:hypothetical protein